MSRQTSKESSLATLIPPLARLLICRRASVGILPRNPFSVRFVVSVLQKQPPELAKTPLLIAASIVIAKRVVIGVLRDFEISLAPPKYYGVHDIFMPNVIH